MNTLLALFIVCVSVAHAFPGPPSYAMCVEVENETGQSIQAVATYEIGVTASADIPAGAVHKFAKKLVEHVSPIGSTYQSVIPVKSFTVSMDRPYVGPLHLTHTIQVTGIHECVKRVVKPNMGGASIE